MCSVWALYQRNCSTTANRPRGDWDYLRFATWKITFHSSISASLVVVYLHAIWEKDACDPQSSMPVFSLDLMCLVGTSCLCLFPTSFLCIPAFHLLNSHCVFSLVLVRSCFPTSVLHLLHSLLSRVFFRPAVICPHLVLACPQCSLSLSSLFLRFKFFSWILFCCLFVSNRLLPAFWIFGYRFSK